MGSLRYIGFLGGLLAIGIILGLGVIFFDPWHQPQSKPVVAPSPATPPPIPCFIRGWDCAKLEKVEWNGQFYGYGVQDSTGNLISPITGSMTTGLMHFTDPANPTYLALILYQADPQGSRLEYLVPADTPASPQAISHGEELMPVPTQANMPPFGPYQVVITASDTYGEIMDPKEFLAP